MDDMSKILNTIVKYALCGLVLLMPLFFLPWTSELLELNKQYLFVFLIVISLMAWLARIISVKKKIFFIRTPLDLWILIFSVTAVLNAVFSADKVSAWIGFYGRFTDSVIFLLAALAMYFILINNVRFNSDRRASLRTILNLFLISSSLVVLVAYGSLLGLWAKIPGWSAIMSAQTFNTVSGSLEGLSVFLAVIVALLAGIFLEGKKAAAKKETVSSFGEQFLAALKKIALPILFIFSLILMVLINFKPAWVILGGTMLFLLAISFWTRLFKERVNVLLIPIILLIISLVGLFIDARGFMLDVFLFDGAAVKESLAQLPQEVILDYNPAWSSIWQGVKERPVLGVGSGIFLNTFARHKPVEFNENRFWNVRFDKAPNQIMEMAATMGLLNCLTYLFIWVIFLLIIGTVFLNKKKLNELADRYPVSDARHLVSLFPFFLAWLALFIGQFVYIQNTVLIFCFWLFAALAIIAWQGIQNKPLKRIDFSFAKLPELGLVANVLLMILAFGGLSLFYLGGRFYWADVKFNQPAAELEQLIQNSEQAVLLNKYRPEYRRSLSMLYLQAAWAEANKPEKERDIPLLEKYARGAIQQIKELTVLSPNLVTSWESAGAVYRDLTGLVEGAAPLAIDSFNRAAELEPTNPFFQRELCRLNLISGDGDLDKALRYCEKAVELKQNYLDAHVQLALVYEKKGKMEAARDRLKETLEQIKGVSFERNSQLAGAIAEVYFQLGRVQLNLNETDQAIVSFTQAIAVMPNHTNARYGLAVAYQAKGKIKDALEQAQIVDQLAPGNENVRGLISQFKARLKDE